MKNTRDSTQRLLIKTPVPILTLFFVLCYLLFVSCDHPFKAGLGQSIDLQAPIIVLKSPGAGAYIRGVTEFVGSASDDIKLASVWFQLSNYPDVTLPGYNTMNHKLGRFHRMTDVTGGIREWDWKFKIDTAQFPDGDFMLRLLVIDSAGKEAATDEIAFYVKNNIPQISMAFPSIVQGSKPGELGGEYLNYGYIKTRSGSFPRAMDTKSLMVGMISDSEGINRSTGEDEGVELFPPQIRFWRVDFEGGASDGSYPIYPPGVLPPVKSGEGVEGAAWEKLELMDIGVNNVQFTYALPNVSGQYFGFEIRAQSSDKSHSIAEYPRSWLNVNCDEENCYVLIYLREPLEYPTLELYKLEDIYGPEGWDSGKGARGGYNDIYIPEPEKTEGNYAYVDRPISGKGGAFTLRMKAYHSGGIASAKVFWEKDDKSAKGRFIWDPADTSPYTGWTGGVVSGIYHYSMWGLYDPHIEGGATTRSFVFTCYDDPARDRIPDTAEFYPGIRGRSKIQVYSGPLSVEGRTLDFDDLPDAAENWQDVNRLEEGTYNLSVYASSSSNTRIAAPFTCSVSIDRQAPELALNYIEGGAGVSSDNINIVNGVVRPRFLLSDSRPVDSGFRTATSDYFLRGDSGRYGYEQAYILIRADQKQAMDLYLRTQPWPRFPDRYAPDDPPRIPGVTISKHGPIADSSCLFKTSKIYENSVTEADALSDGLYWLYAFGRDNAFNAGGVSFPIEVKKSSDDPAFDFSVGSVSVEVKQPDAAYDRPNSNEGSSFIAGGVIRNKFTANSNIRVRIKDDDSLDPGVYGGAASGIRVTFVGSETEAGETKAYTDPAYSMELTDDEIKTAFAPQTVERRPVKEILGAISQAMLLNRLKENQKYNYLFGCDPLEIVSPIPANSVKHGFNSLPDGIYRVGIDIKDYSGAKLIMEEGDEPAAEVTRSEYFWIAVDNKSPVTGAEVSPQSGSFISATTPVNLEGSVSDENGPITAISWAVYDNRTPLTGANAPRVELKPMTRRPFGADGKWTYDFSFPMSMNNNSGTFTFEVKFQDRFGNTSTLTQRYSSDNEPPVVTLTKLIETFERDMADVDISPYIQLNATPAGVKENKERLAVKVVSFSLSANDNFKVEGIRWWLLPANAGSNQNAFDTSGLVPDYDAFPAKSLPDTPDKVYYGTDNTTDPYYTAGFDRGAYGVVDVANRKFTIAVNSEKMTPENGEYRLHIIAIDSAGNVSRVTENAAKAPTSSVLQTVFFLQEEDKPYFDSISPAGLSVIGETGLVVRGTLFENNGFNSADGTGILPGSIRVWFKTADTPDPDNIGDLVDGNSPIPGYAGPKTISSGLGRTGRNLSLAFNLKDAFNTDEIGEDGPKSYIIKATDSPVNKLRENGTQAGTGDEGMRVSRWKKYFFVYDNVPPEINITSPETGAPFGKNFDKDFIIAGYMADANLKTTAEGKYYFEYYLDNETTRKPFALEEGKHYTAVQNPADSGNGIQVNFTIDAREVADNIIDNFEGLGEGPHTLTLIAGDLSGKETPFMCNFIKDVTPPVIGYTNIGNTDPVSTIYYDTGRPALTGTFQDEVSDIAVTVDANNFNISSSSFKYWLDAKSDSDALFPALIDGSGRNVRWSIYLTEDGKESGKALGDGLHTIIIEVADTSGAVNDEHLKLAFRLDSKQPKAAIAAPSRSVFGSSAYQNEAVFTIGGTASDANLSDLELRITDKSSGEAIKKVSFRAPGASGDAVNVTKDCVYTPAASSLDDDAVTLAWTYSVVKTLFDTLINGKSYDLTVTAIDWAGNRSEEALWTFTVDTSRPVISFTNPAGSDARGDLRPGDFIDISKLPELSLNASAINNINRLAGENLRIQGRVTDAYSAIRGLESRVEKWDWDSGAWDIVIEDWEPVLDLSTNRFFEVNWTKNLSGQEGGLNLGADADGLYRVQLRAKDESFTELGTNDWSLETGIGNPALSEYVYFYYDRNSPELTLNGDMVNFYSTKLIMGKFEFSGTVRDNNRFAKIEVKIEPADDKFYPPVTVKYQPGAQTVLPADSNQGAKTQSWAVNFTGVPDNSDGRYRVTAVVYDMTGNAYSVARDFTLDNTGPGARFTLPAKESGRAGFGADSVESGFASVIVNGGETAVITGETWDRSNNNSESGIDRMWFRLGFLDGGSDFPEKADIDNDAERLIDLARAGNSGKTVNELMDIVSEHSSDDEMGNAWFRLGGTLPTGFIINNPNIYDWRMEVPSIHPDLGQIGGLKLYGGQVTVKGRLYDDPNDPSASRQMARPVEGQSGVYRLPLWIRLIDKVGNVEYYCHDIWFYPDGDIPTTTIENPENGNVSNARGGTVSVDGVARSNTSVYDVIFRVFADNKTDAGVLPSAADFAAIPNYSLADAETRKIITDNGYGGTDWYRADLTLRGGAGEPLIPWGVTLNAQEEITKLIASRGFASAGSGANDTIRVRLEVFVFNGEGAPIRSSVCQEDGGDADSPKPYVRIFYIKSAAPQITHPNVGDWKSGSLVWNYEEPTAGPSNPGGYGYKGAGTEVRRGRFAVRAILDPSPTGNSELAQVSFRTRLNNGSSGWTILWSSGDAYPDGGGVRISENNDLGRARYNFEYAVDSTATADVYGFAAVDNGVWAFSGGSLTVQVRIKDSANNEAEQSITVGVDNFAPLSDPEYITNDKVAGTNVDFIGRVFDYATAPAADAMPDSAPRKIDRVYAWFVKKIRGEDYYVNINDGQRSTDPGLRTMAAMAGRGALVVKQADNETISAVTVTYKGSLADISYPYDAGWVRELSETTAQPGTRMLWNPVNAADIRWSFNVDSTRLPDGALTLCYLVVDAVGNAGYYEQTVTVRNRYPVIDSVTLYTDNNGMGAAFTQADSAEYVLNDYRKDMFNNQATYTDADKTGYLNSGFIAKNRFLGFKVEALNGNRDLNFRVQHVTRERIELNLANLTQMTLDREDPGKINLYTIAWHGGYSNARWKALGVPVDNPTLGTHFVPQMSGAAAAYVDSSDKPAEVWRYTPVVSRDAVTPAGQPEEEAVAFGPDDRFGFSGGGHFETDTPERIGEFNGSYPEPGEEAKNDPDDTAFFLIRVWDSISPRVDYATNEKWVNDQLYDALVVGMNVYLTDTTHPVARLYDLNPYTETAVVNNNITDANKAATIRNAADPVEVGGNIVKGGLFNTKTTRDVVKSGYIDPRDNSTALDPVNSGGLPVVNRLKVEGDAVGTGAERDKVSGRIILRGIAWDDQLIDEIRIKIGADDEKAILKLVNGKMTAQGSQAAYAVEDLHWKNGHTVEWAYVWDTEKEPASANSGPMSEVEITVSVVDRIAGLGNGAAVPVSAENGSLFHNTVKVDIVPYITGFERELPKFSTKRSLQGWYSFYRGEDNIAALGYNFGTNTVTMNLGAVSLTVTATPALSSRRVFSIPDDASYESGAITLNVSSPSTQAYNQNSGIENRSWNREYNVYTPGSDLWINKPHAHIWQSRQTVGTGTTTAGTIFGAEGTTVGLDSPAMALQFNGPSAGRLHGVWAVKNRNSFFYAQNNGDDKLQDYLKTDPVPEPTQSEIDLFWLPASILLSRAGEPYTYTDIDYFNAGDDDYINNVSTTAVYQRNAAARMILKPTVNAVVFHSPGTTGGGGDDVGYIITRSGASTDYYQNARIRKAAPSANTSDPGRVFVTVYDSGSQALAFASHGGVNLIDGLPISGYPRNGNQWWLYGASLNGAGSYYGPYTGANEIAGPINGGIYQRFDGGQWSDIDYDSAGRPVAFFPDDANRAPMLAYAADKIGSGNINYNWTIRYVLPESHALRSGSGTYCSMKIQRTVEDGTGTDEQGDADLIHLAFYNQAHKTLVYAVGTRLGHFKAWAIDNVNGGQWTDISLDKDGNPWIVYADTTRIGNRDGARIAYKSSGTDASFTRPLADPVVPGQYITGWETMTMPADYEVNEDRLSIAVWPPIGVDASETRQASPIGGWHAAVGYGSDQFRVGYFFKPTVPAGF